MSKLAHRMNRIEPFHVMDLLAKAKGMEAEGREIIHLEVGEPDFTTPSTIVDAGIAALKAGKTHYTGATGIPELKSAISAFYQDRYQAEVAADRIIITPGASGALQLLTSILVNPGENLILENPGYPCNRHFLRLISAEGKLVDTQPESKFHLTPEQITSNWDSNSTGALVASPANPTGGVLTQDDLKQLYETVTKLNGVLIVDEIYHGLTYGCDAPTAANLGDQAFVINSFSKYFGMTGWRLGWLVAPQWAVSTIDKLAQNLFLAPSTPAQYAALSAFEPDTLSELESRRKAFSDRRDYLLPELRTLGFDVPVEPQGAFYVYCNVTHFCQDSMAFCNELLEQQGVAITPGIDFGQPGKQQWVRFAYTADIPVLKEAVSRIKQFLDTKNGLAGSV